MGDAMMDKWMPVSKSDPCAACGEHDQCSYNESSLRCMRRETLTPYRYGPGWIHAWSAKERAAARRDIEMTT